ncbi:DUF1653 domain-containing protein [Candidatus Woesebacteria bacterium]|nr:DUF1653 domain-containing protein [Candidatus Woesebacteria bacterium]
MIDPSHISHTELNQRIADASKLVELGAIYKHYKYPERDYKVLGYVIQEATQKVAIVYRNIKEDDAPQFCRDLSSWLETVEWNGAIVPRFKKVIL